MPKHRPYRDDRPIGPNLDPFDPNNLPNHRDLGHGEREDTQLAWIFVAIFVIVVLLAI